MKLLVLVLALVVVSATAHAQDALRFAILRGGSPIGTHTVTFSRDDAGNLVAETDINIRVRIALIPVFRYVHHSREVWRDGRLIALDASTDDDGRPFTVRARATPAGLEVEGSQGRFIAPADILPTSWWRADTPQRRQLLDTRMGRLATVTAVPLGNENRQSGGRQEDVRMWRIEGALRLTVGYTAHGRWAAMRFDARGSTIEYGQQDAVAGQ